jgi:GntR family transcriptional regulator, transcriptional repressor for pyruvate dehydrogenase complex
MSRGEASQRQGNARASELRSEQAYRRTLSLITEGGLVDGDRLPSETVLAARFGISRPLIRQALSRLQAAGVVDVRWGAGSYVRDPAGAERQDPSFGPVGSLEEVRQAFELRQAVEGDAAALAAKHRPPTQLTLARQALAALDHAVATGAIGQQPDIDFHFAIAAAAQNPLFERVLQSIRRSIEFTISLTRSMALTHPVERLRLVQSEHVAIMQAIEAGDPQLARQAMRAHLANSCARLFLGPGAVEPDANT